VVLLPKDIDILLSDFGDVDFDTMHVRSLNLMMIFIEKEQQKRFSNLTVLVSLSFYSRLCLPQ
jgi:hypothetical protein